MNGYLMQEQDWMPGQDLFIESFSPENRFGVVFEDDGEAAYFYAVEKDAEGGGLRILDALHIWSDDEDAEGSGGEVREEADDAREKEEGHGNDAGEEESEGGDDTGEQEEGDDDGESGQGDAADDVADGDSDGPSRLLLVWARDWMKCALVIDGACEALYDFAAQGGYSIDEFPPPNEFWTKGDRKLSEELIKKLF
jgi:hypothetical protein